MKLEPGSFLVGIGVGAMVFWMLDRVGTRELGHDFVSPKALTSNGDGQNVLEPEVLPPVEAAPMSGRVRNPAGFQLPPLVEGQLRRLVQSGVRVCVDKFGDGVQYLIDEATGRTPIVTANRNGIMVNQPAIEARIRLIPEIMVDQR